MATDPVVTLHDDEGVVLTLTKPETMRCPYCAAIGLRTADRLVRRRGQGFRSSVWEAVCGSASNGNRIERGVDCKAADHE